jgi:hypothetical protein
VSTTRSDRGRENPSDPTRSRAHNPRPEGRGPSRYPVATAAPGNQQPPRTLTQRTKEEVQAAARVSVDCHFNRTVVSQQGHSSCPRLSLARPPPAGVASLVRDKRVRRFSARAPMR